MTSTERDRPAALAASEASQAKAKRENAKHTPGPWAYHNTPTPFLNVNAGGLPICQIYTSTAHGQSMGEQFANARLIAAAPELLEALELIANTGMDARQCMLTARAAIKKAIGDTP